jgi:hypothetical protein
VPSWPGSSPLPLSVGLGPLSDGKIPADCGGTSSPQALRGASSHSISVPFVCAVSVAPGFALIFSDCFAAVHRDVPGECAGKIAGPGSVVVVSSVAINARRGNPLGRGYWKSKEEVESLAAEGRPVPRR